MRLFFIFYWLHVTWCGVYIQQAVNEAVKVWICVIFFTFHWHFMPAIFFLHNTFMLITNSLLPSLLLSSFFLPLSIIGFYFRAAISVCVSCVCVSHPILCLSSIVVSIALTVFVSQCAALFFSSTKSVLQNLLFLGFLFVIMNKLWMWDQNLH